GGVVKRVVPDYRGWEEWAVIALKDGDRVVGAGPAAEADEVVFVASDAQLLRCPARAVRPQGRQAGGMAGLKLAPAASVIAFAAVPRGRQDDTVVATAAGTADPRRPVDWSVKVTPLAAFPAKGRATGGVRCHRFLKGQDALVLASVGPAPALACDQAGEPRNLPAADLRRDGSGSVLGARLFALG
ncbi:MAG: DNA topoisomerase IV, partial [Propionibacteriaceae bacterium]|nr:DNA topoisomerase IV [Propionibacteriaceae bacterium]